MRHLKSYKVFESSIGELMGDKAWKLIQTEDFNIHEIERVGTKLKRDQKFKFERLVKDLVQKYSGTSARLSNPDFTDFYTSYQAIISAELKYNINAVAISIDQAQDEWWIIDVAYLFDHDATSSESELYDSITYLADGDWGLEQFFKEFPLQYQYVPISEASRPLSDDKDWSSTYQQITTIQAKNSFQRRGGWGEPFTQSEIDRMVRAVGGKIYNQEAHIITLWDPRYGGGQVVVSKAQDEWYFVMQDVRGTLGTWYECDGFDGLLKCLENL